MVAAFPCGVITVLEELYGSESLTQVYAIMVEYLAALPKKAREEIIEIAYDDACHFKKFSENKVRAAKNDITLFMANSIGKHVDKFHFPNHVDSWCHANCNPSDVKHLDGVNTPICEQLFSAINKFTNAKSMNEAHFFMLFLYIFDLHNLNIEKKLRSVANPKSEHRYEIIKNFTKKAEVENAAMKTEAEAEIDIEVNDVEILLKSLYVDASKEVINPISNKPAEFSCEACKAKYKKEGMLKLHVKNKHPDSNWEDIAPKVKYCKVCSSPFTDENELKKHLSTHFKCTVCDIPFDDQKYLNRHMKVNHSPICCEVCGVECSDKEVYNVHINIHLQCDLCGKEFDKQHKLKRHMKSHA